MGKTTQLDVLCLQLFCGVKLWNHHKPVVGLLLLFFTKLDLFTFQANNRYDLATKFALWWWLDLPFSLDLLQHSILETPVIPR